MRVVPNLYPALERQEVVVHGPEHATSFGGLRDSTIEHTAEAWQRRARDAGGNCFAILNEGWDAGSSLPHSHSQLAWLPAPAAPAGELPERVPVLARDGVAAACPVAGRGSYELVIAPERPEPDGLRSELLAPALRLLAELVRRLQHVRGETALNAWLLAGTHWRLEVLPRTTRLAGLELGAGVFVVPVAPETAAAQLRDAG